MDKNNLRRQLLEVSGKISAENPLQVIGLAPSILGLGLNDQDLFEVVRFQARKIFTMVHTDRVELTPAVVEAQAKFSQAFNQLDDFQRFKEYLRDFQVVRAESRTEFNQHLQIIRLLREQISGLETMIRQEQKRFREKEEDTMVLGAIKENFLEFLMSKAALYNKNGQLFFSTAQDIQTLSVIYYHFAGDNKGKKKLIPVQDFLKMGWKGLDQFGFTCDHAEALDTLQVYSKKRASGYPFISVKALTLKSKQGIFANPHVIPKYSERILGGVDPDDLVELVPEPKELRNTPNPNSIPEFTSLAKIQALLYRNIFLVTDSVYSLAPQGVEDRAKRKNIQTKIRSSKFSRKDHHRKDVNFLMHYILVDFS